MWSYQASQYFLNTVYIFLLFSTLDFQLFFSCALSKLVLDKHLSPETKNSTITMPTKTVLLIGQ